MKKEIRAKTIRDLTAFFAGAAWSLPLGQAVKDFIDSDCERLRLDLVGISCLVAVLFAIWGGKRTNEKIN